jgi:hypothetical protein
MAAVSYQKQSALRRLFIDFQIKPSEIFELRKAL